MNSKSLHVLFLASGLAASTLGWNTILRLYAPQQPWFDKSWKPGDFEEVKAGGSS